PPSLRNHPQASMILLYSSSDIFLTSLDVSSHTVFVPGFNSYLVKVILNITNKFKKSIILVFYCGIEPLKPTKSGIKKGVQNLHPVITTNFYIKLSRLNFCRFSASLLTYFAVLYNYSPPPIKTGA